MSIQMLDDASMAGFSGLDGGFAFAAYVDGYGGYSWLQSNRGGRQLLSISIHGNIADCLDMESGAASFGSAPGWFHQMKSLGRRTIVMYSSAGNSQLVINTLANAGISRSNYTLWSAHIEVSDSHICGPGQCGYPQADGTQNTWTFLGRSLDHSLLHDDFFNGGKPPPPAPEVLLKLGDNSPSVARAQGLLNKHGAKPQLLVDGSFGPVTEKVVYAFQKSVKLTHTGGQVGPRTWADLNK